MAHTKLVTTLSDLTKSLTQMEKLSVAAQRWAYGSFSRGLPKFTIHYMEFVTEMAFLAWETFLEESFILYLCGKPSPSGKKPKRFANPPSRKVAEQLVVTKGRDYADWTDVGKIIKRAEHFFGNGEPYSAALRSHQSRLQDIKILRNAIAHSSSYSWEQFQVLIRQEFGTYPPTLNIGRFLSMTVPGSSPPISFLEHYVVSFRIVANIIVPS